MRLLVAVESGPPFPVRRHHPSGTSETSTLEGTGGLKPFTEIHCKQRRCPNGEDNDDSGKHSIGLRRAFCVHLTLN